MHFDFHGPVLAITLLLTFLTIFILDFLFGKYIWRVVSWTVWAVVGLVGTGIAVILYCGLFDPRVFRFAVLCLIAASILIAVRLAPWRTIWRSVWRKEHVWTADRVFSNLVWALSLIICAAVVSFFNLTGITYLFNLVWESLLEMYETKWLRDARKQMHHQAK